jgi:hypothetical protein
VDGSAISVFAKIRRFATRGGIELVLSDVDRPELRRVAGASTRPPLTSTTAHSITRNPKTTQRSHARC